MEIQPNAPSLFLENVGLYLSKPVVHLSVPLIRSIATPIRPGVEGNLSSAFFEKIRRVFTVSVGALFVPIAVPLALLGSLIQKIADLIKQRPFTYLDAGAPIKKENGKHKLMTGNACMLWGGLPIPLGGMRSPPPRTADLAAKILSEEPDVYFGQELAFDPASSLFERIKHKYRVYTRIGPNPPLMESGLFVATKYHPIYQKFIPFPNQLGIYRGAFLLETEKSVFITTHMEYNNEKRGLAQLQLILDEIAKYKGKKPCFLLGDFNLDRRTNLAFAKKLKEHFHDPYPDNEPTCTDYFQAHMLGKKNETPDELVDYALQARDPKFQKNLQLERITNYDKNKPYSALSDHKFLKLFVNT